MNNALKLAGKTALVTGAGSEGIGKAVALALARDGADVAVHGYMDHAAADRVSEDVRACGVRSRSYLADLSIPEQACTLVQAVVDDFGGLDIVVCNAGKTLRKPLLASSVDDFRDLLALNLEAYFAVSRDAAIHMRTTGRTGRIVMISSINQHVIVPGQGLYCATKGAVMQLAKAFAVELASDGITVNLVAPGQVRSDFNRHLFEDPAFAHASEQSIPVGRPGTPAEIAGAVTYFADPASSYVTGTTIIVDGGKSLA